MYMASLTACQWHASLVLAIQNRHDSDVTRMSLGVRPQNAQQAMFQEAAANNRAAAPMGHPGGMDAGMLMAAGGRPLDPNDPQQQLKKVRMRHGMLRVTAHAAAISKFKSLSPLHQSHACERVRLRRRRCYPVGHQSEVLWWGSAHMLARGHMLTSLPGFHVVQRKTGGRMHSLGDMTMSGEGVPSKFSGSQSDDDEEGGRLGGLDGDGEEGARGGFAASISLSLPSMIGISSRIKWGLWCMHARSGGFYWIVRPVIVVSLLVLFFVKSWCGECKAVLVS